MFWVIVHPVNFSPIIDRSGSDDAEAGVTIIPYLVDFLIIADTFAECAAAQQQLISLLISLGFCISWSKVVSPTTREQFLGLILDSVRQTLQSPQDKLKKLAEVCGEYTTAGKVTKVQLQFL